MKYCQPLNAGLASEPAAVGRRISRVVEALDNEINANVVDGLIINEVRAFRAQLLEKLQHDGWSFSYCGGNKLKCRQPGHKKPYPIHA